MRLRCDSEFIFIGRGDETFLESYTYERTRDAEDSALSGRIFAVIEIIHNTHDAQEISDAIFHTFKSAYYESRKEDPYHRFEEALKQVNATINLLKEEKHAKFIGNLNVAIGAVVDHELFISTAGEADVYLVRRHFVSLVSDGLADETVREAFVNIANGTLETDDVVLFSTTKLLRYLSKQELAKLFERSKGATLGDALTELQDFVMHEILGRAVVIGVAIRAQGDEIAAEDESDGLPPMHSAVFQKISAVAERIQSLLKPAQLRASPKIRMQLAEWLDRARQLFKFEKLRQVQPRISFRSRLSREKILGIIIVLLVLLIGGVFWVRTRGSYKRIVAQEQAKLNIVRDLVQDATTIGESNKEKAAQLLDDAQQRGFEVLNARYLKNEALTLLDEIKKVRDGVDKIQRISQPQVAANLADKRSSVNLLGLLGMKDKIFAFEYNALYEILLDQLQDPLTISGIDTVILGAPYEDNNGLLFLTKTGKMIEYADAHFTITTTRDGLWKKGVSMEAYGDRVYILDPDRNQIFRYERIRGGFESAQEYNKDADVSKGVDIAIDGAIYILGSDGFITQLYQGQKQSFPLKKLPLSSIETPTKIFTNADLAYLYVLEPKKQRVLLFRKDRQNGGAVYASQYVFENVGELRDLLVTKDRLYVADASKVYAVGLAEL